MAVSFHQDRNGVQQESTDFPNT